MVGVGRYIAGGMADEVDVTDTPGGEVNTKWRLRSTVKMMLIDSS